MRLSFILLFSFHTFSCLGEEAAEKTQKEPSHVELARKFGKEVLTLLSNEDYAGLEKSFIDADLAEKLGIMKGDKSKFYREYVANVKALAKRYRKFLSDSELLNGKNLEFVPGPSLQKESEARSFLVSNGIGMKSDDKKIELIDQAVFYDGKWYLLKLVTEKDEKALPQELDNQPKK